MWQRRNPKCGEHSLSVVGCHPRRGIIISPVGRNRFRLAPWVCKRRNTSGSCHLLLCITISLHHRLCTRVRMSSWIRTRKSVKRKIWNFLSSRSVWPIFTITNCRDRTILTPSPIPEVCPVQIIYINERFTSPRIATSRVITSCHPLPPSI